ncbi:Lysine-specific demethylase 5A [Sesamum alatum]|uniref:Lysine-specific demethylase 5A n=1 Tax=Sesamum alatum TaxID=300844 RepID=A0AAE1Y2W0_9LAMI|nr:Lysine-specific demethylase 5A [Sesamum alatum]
MGRGRTRKVEKGVLGGSLSGGLSSGSGSLTVPAGPAIHQLQARSAPCDSKTFRLEYNRFLEEHCGKKAKKRVVFEGEDLDLCKLFNAVKRFGGYDNVVKLKKWGDIFRFVRPGRKISECSKHVLSQLYCEHLADYEEYYCQLNKEKNKSSKWGMSGWKKCEPEVEVSSVKRRRKNKEGERVERIPPGNWYCLECVNSEKDTFGFVPGKQFSLEAFRRMADRIKKKWFGSAATSWVQLEKKFWEIVEGSVGEVEVMYGSDLDTSVYGSGFPRQVDQRPPSVEVDVWSEYCASPWNLNNLPRLQGSMLRAVHQNIAGVMVPWLYIGMLFSSFCWHFEDHCLYSMNYHHWGEPKCWYSVPGNEAHAFEKVMRSCLPDLFEAQPDLLFQLVTMLNPSVLQERGVPVYSIIQEPGNFVITFPRSYHGGFNLGLNCAEAVNFAPADWLPHGGFGAELYRHYHRVPVLSHEELLYVVAKSEFDSRASTFLEKELRRIYNNEKTWRERLWRNGITKSSPMTPRVKPEYVGTEEDPMCVICQQLLYLSAVSCNCRPAAYVCLEHWEHLCECKPNKLRLLYRHTLAELSDLLLKVDKCNSIEAAADSRMHTCSEKAVALAKKVKGGHVTYLQLAEEWILRSCKILEHPYSRHAYVSAVEEAEQFLWAGHEMDLVREIKNNLIQAQNWAEAVRDCLSKVKLWSSNHSCDTERVQMDQVDELLGLRTPPCNEPSHLQLKEYHEDARKLIQEIDPALTSCSGLSVADLEILYLKAFNSPIHINESEKLGLKLSAAKVWVDNVRKCISEKACSSVEVDMLHKLESEYLDLKLQLPDADLLTNLMRRVKSCRSRCVEILKDPICLKELKLFVSEWEDFTVNIPELELLKKYYTDTISWISRVDLVLMNVHQREDQEKVVDELTSIQREGLLLQVQVDKLPCIELELKRARCRVEGLKVLRNQMSMDFVQQLLSEAATLQIEKEKLFSDISQRHAIAMCWEEKAKHVLATRARMSDFEDVLRASEHIGIILPSLLDVKLAVSTAKSWLMKSKPFLLQDSSILLTSDSYLQVDVLKELVLESKDLKVYFEECSLLEKLLKRGVEWEQEASSLLQNAEHLWNIDIIGEGITSCLIPRLECQVLSMETAVKAGISLGLDFNMIPKLQDACSTLKWCIKALSFSTIIPAHKDVEMMLDTAASRPVTFKSSALWTALIDGLGWLKKSLEILDSNNHGHFEVNNVVELLVLSKKNCISFPMVVGRLQDAVESHKLWLEEVDVFFGLSFEERSWIKLLQLKEHGTSKAFSCVELAKVQFELEKVLKWKQRCVDIIKPPPAEENPLLNALIELNNTLDRSLEVYSKCKSGKSRNLCICCSCVIEDQDLLPCSICNDSFHLQCAETSLGNAKLFVCRYCDLVKSPKLPRSEAGSLKTVRTHLELGKLTVLLSDASNLCLWINERRILDQIVKKAVACNACLTEFVSFALAYVSKDLDVVRQKLCVALKAMDVVGISDDEGNRKFELALAQNSWKIRAEKLLGSAEKPTLQQIQHHLKEGLAMNIQPEDYYRQTLTKIRDMGLQWADAAKKVSMDGGMLGLDRVFELISQGESLPVSCEKELKLLRDRSMLYCICRRPYDQRAMVACDECDEWYHFDCIKISSAPKVYICPACSPYPGEDISAPITQERFTGNKFEEPQTPLRRSELRRNSQKPKSTSNKILMATDMNDSVRNFSSSESLLWRNRKPFRRAARKRSELQSLSPFFHVQNK